VKFAKLNRSYSGKQWRGNVFWTGGGGGGGKKKKKIFFHLHQLVISMEAGSYTISNQLF